MKADGGGAGHEGAAIQETGDMPRKKKFSDAIDWIQPVLVTETEIKLESVRCKTRQSQWSFVPLDKSTSFELLVSPSV